MLHGSAVRTCSGHPLRELECARKRQLDTAAGHESHPDDYRLALGASHRDRTGADVALDIGGLGRRAKRDHGALVRPEHDSSGQSVSDADPRPVRWCMWLQSSRHRLLAGMALLLLLAMSVSCGVGGLATSSAPRWACPSPTPKPWGAAGPV